MILAGRQVDAHLDGGCGRECGRVTVEGADVESQVPRLDL